MLQKKGLNLNLLNLQMNRWIQLGQHRGVYFVLEQARGTADSEQTKTIESKQRHIRRQ